MKLVPTEEKITIKWFWVTTDGKKYRNTKGFVHNAWDVECSCGWKTVTGGAIKSSVIAEVEFHKYVEHKYSYSSAKAGA